MKIFEGQKKQWSYLSTCSFANSMAKIRNNLKSLVGATSARVVVALTEKPSSLKFEKGFEEWSRWRRGLPFFERV
jgi:hypothetical protein